MSTFADRTDLPCPRIDMIAWFRAACADGAWWKSSVLSLERMSRRHIRVRTRRERTLDCGEFHCDYPECTRSFESFSSLMSHKHNCHGYRNPLRLRITGSVCLCCSVEFHGRSRLFRHVAWRSGRCKAYYLELEPNTVLDSDALDREVVATRNAVSRKRLRRPAVQIPLKP